MANSLSNILDKILARGLMTLREAAVMPRLVNIDYSSEAAQQGNTIDVPKPVAQAVSDVAASANPKAAADKQPGLVQIALDQWKTTDFYLTDKEMAEINRNRHFVPMQTAEAARALANTADLYIHSFYTGVYGFIGTAGVVPFSTVATATGARRVLNAQLAPMSERRVVVDPTAEDQALQLSAFSDLEKTGDQAVKIEGTIGRKFGLDFYMSQNVVTHTAGTIAGGEVTVGSTTAAGASAVEMAGGSTLGTVVVGDIFTIAGNSQSYTVKGAETITSAGVDVSISPGLAAVASSGSAISIKATHVVNLAFNRNAFALATRPLAAAVEGMPVVESTIVDNVTGLVLRIELVRQNKQTAFQFDMLYGAQLVRPEFAARIAG